MEWKITSASTSVRKEDWAIQGTEDVDCGATHDQLGQCAAAVRAHDDEVGATPLCHVENGPARMPVLQWRDNALSGDTMTIEIVQDAIVARRRLAGRKDDYLRRLTQHRHTIAQ